MEAGDGAACPEHEVSVIPATPADYRDIVRIHVAAFPEFFMTRLGPPFLRVYYDLVSNFDGGILLVAKTDGRAVGFAAGSLPSDQFYRHLWRRAGRFVPAVALAVLNRPSLLRQVFRSARSMSRSGEPETTVRGPRCELSSLAVEPSFGGMGLGRALVDAFLGEAKRRGAACVVLTTDAAGNDRVNRFYQTLGFSKSREIHSGPGRTKNEYMISLTPRIGPRPGPVTEQPARERR